MGYVDLHSHILYGLDDGAKTFEESVAMLRIAAESGTTDIVATPHANSRYRFDRDLVEARIAELREHTTVRIHRGCDFRLQPDTITDAIAHPQKYTINGHGYLLVEFPDLGIFTSTEEVLSQLLGAGMVPIITHPERNRHLQQHVDDVARWVEMGCYVQVTAGSCVGTFGKAARRFVDVLMERGLVHFVASDAHDVKHRSPDLRAAFTEWASKWGDDAAARAFNQNPSAVIEGEELELSVAARPRKRRKWYWPW